jgi:hypothetical protein
MMRRLLGWKIATAAQLGIPQGVASRVESNGRAVVVVQGLVLRKEDGLHIPRTGGRFQGRSRSLRGRLTGSTPVSSFSRTRSASDFATGSSPEGTKLAPDEPRRNVLHCYTRSPHRDELPLGHSRHLRARRPAPARLEVRRGVPRSQRRQMLRALAAGGGDSLEGPTRR